MHKDGMKNIRKDVNEKISHLAKAHLDNVKRERDNLLVKIKEIESFIKQTEEVIGVFDDLNSDDYSSDS